MAGRPHLVGFPTHLRLLEPLGAGGSGTVWAARDTRRGRDVAVKLVDRADGARLDVEVRALARLADVPGVLALLECGTTESGAAWLVTRRLPGGSLAERRVGIAEAVSVAGKLAATLAAVHERSVVHGDITPSNVLFDEAGEPLLIDLGLAWLGAGEPAAGPGGCTPAFAAPERLRGAPASAPSDVFALAATVLHVAGRTAADPGDDVPQSLLDALAERPSTRPTAAELASSLRRRFRRRL